MDKKPKRSSTSRGAGSESGRGRGVGADNGNARNVAGPGRRGRKNGPLGNQTGTQHRANVPPSSSTGETGPASNPDSSVATVANAPVVKAVVVARKQHVVRQRSQKIVLAPSSSDDPIYHIYGELASVCNYDFFYEFRVRMVTL